MSLTSFCILLSFNFELSAHMAWMMENTRMSIFRQTLQILARLLDHDFWFLHKWNLGCLLYTSSYFCKILLVKIAKAIYDVEEATSTAFSIILDHKVKGWILCLC